MNLSSRILAAVLLAAASLAAMADVENYGHAIRYYGTGTNDNDVLFTTGDMTQHSACTLMSTAGAVDAHAHVIGLPPAYPFMPNRSYTPPAAPGEAYIAMLDATGMTYGVLVQVSVHGTDNRKMLEVLRAHPDRLRGIAVVPLDLPQRELVALKDAGVVGLRLNVLYGGGIGFDQLEAYGALARDMGWHLQFLIDARDLTPLASRIGKLPVPVVVDHWGHFPVARA